MDKGIAVAGNMILDVLKPVTGLPVRHSLEKIKAKSYSLGGAVCNVIRDLASLDPGLPLKAVGLVGTDGEGDVILQQLAAYQNIDLRRVARRGMTSSTDVLYEEEAKARTFLTFGGVGDEFDCGDVDVNNLDCDLFHIGYILLLAALDAPDAQYGTRMARLLHDVQAAGIHTSVDVVSEASDRYQRLVPPALKYADYFIVNEIEGGKSAGLELRDEKENLLLDRVPEALSRLKAMGVKRWAVIHALEGGFGIDEAGRYFQVPSLDLPDGFIAGTVGAGDAFCAGVLYAAYRGEALEQALRDGVASAACSLRRAGASEGMAPIGEVRALYRQMPKKKL